MESIYQAHFGLDRDPFNITPDPTFLYFSASHREALAQFCYGVKAHKGFMVLTGEVGTGKTTLIHALLNELASDSKTALIFSTILSPQDLLRSICEDFGLVESLEKRKDFHDYVTLLNHFLLESYRKGDNCALIIDEAQNLSPQVLECIRMLSNFETCQDKLLQILIVGQPELGARLNSPELRQLKQRVALRHHLSPLGFRECREYIARRIEVAGGSPAVFTSKAIEAIYAYSGGIPRLVNILCDNGMLTAYALSEEKIDAPIIREVAEDLNLTVQPKGVTITMAGTSRQAGHAAGSAQGAKQPVVSGVPREHSRRNHNSKPKNIGAFQRWRAWALLLAVLPVFFGGALYFLRPEITGIFFLLNHLISEIVKELILSLRFDL